MPYPIIYVDSGSIDDSVRMAHGLGVTVVELDTSKPFSAARARNEGFASLISDYPGLRFVQFLDGDCTLARGWIESAENSLKEESERAAVIGHLHEIDADASPYNRLCALEWKSEAGDLTDYGNFGGISMISTRVFQQLGGFNPIVIAGEDSEFATRIRIAGFKVTKIDCPMASHDAGMTSFLQWFKRSIRAGHAIGQRADIAESSNVKDCVRERRSTLFWGVGIPILILLLAAPSSGWSFILLIGYAVLGFRVYRYRRTLGDEITDALLYAKYLVIAKFANGIGLCKYYINKSLNRFEIIEYK